MSHHRMSRMLKRFAAAAALIGLIFCMMNMADFSDRNLGLMVGIGFLIGGVFILLFGAALPLMLQHQADPISSTVRE